MSDTFTDILMITYNRPEYTRLSLRRLLETADERTRVWVWHNGTHEPTLEIVRAMTSHPRLFKFHHCPENKKLREPTNWFWANATGSLLGKVDDDILVPNGWIQTFRKAHEEQSEFGLIAPWPFHEEDVVPELAAKKVRRFGKHQLMLQCWVGGMAYLMKRQCAERLGPIQEGESFPRWSIRLAAEGWVNGWYYPLMLMENMDDPRSPNTLLKTEEDFARLRGLSAQQFGVKTLEDYRRRQPKLALMLQKASVNPRDYLGWRGRVRRAVTKVRQAVRSGERLV